MSCERLAAEAIRAPTAQGIGITHHVPRGRGGGSIIASRGLVKRLYAKLETEAEHSRRKFGAHDLAWGARRC